MYLVKNVDLYAPAHRGVVDILMIGGVFAAIGPGLAPGIEGITEVDGAGCAAVPGFIDQHTHLTGGGGEGGFDTRTPQLELSQTVRAGVTSLVGLLGTDSFTHDVESLVAKTKELKKGGLSAWCLTGAYQYPSITVTGSVTKDIVYIEEVIGCKLAIADHRCSLPTCAEITRLAADIRMASLIAGKPGVLHLHVGASKKGMEDIFRILRDTDLPAWHFRPTHMEGHPEQAVEFTRLGGYADVTAEPEEAASFCKLARQAAPGMLTLSSDAGGSIPKWNDKREIIGVGVGGMDTLWQTVGALVREHGIPLEQALCYITENVAKALRMYPRKGCVQIGSDADLVLLDEAGAPHTVFARGKAMMLSGKVLARGLFEPGE
ncbi:beta-aspartyl-peptidase [Ruminococcaceae bacterium OttesenSCG-928-D13]|nr:beta-aspartyl-peptidase [Ruminococcaceae bacterium OttesenSCG-928-D13]